MSAETILQPQPDTEDTGVFLRRWTHGEFNEAIQRGWFDPQTVALLDGLAYDRYSGKPYRMTRERYAEAAESGWYNGQRVELIYGEVYQKLPQRPTHTMGIRATAETLEFVFEAGYDVRQQLPLILATDGEPEPDVLVVPGSWRDYAHHPTQDNVVLLVEVSDTTLHYDQNGKAMLYAEAGIADYWLLNLQNRTLEVRREPEQTAEGFGYRQLTVYMEAESAVPLSAPQSSVLVADLLPPQTQTEG